MALWAYKNITSHIPKKSGWTNPPPLNVFQKNLYGLSAHSKITLFIFPKNPTDLPLMFFRRISRTILHTCKTAAESPGSKIFTYDSKWNGLAYARPNVQGSPERRSRIKCPNKKGPIGICRRNKFPVVQSLQSSFSSFVSSDEHICVYYM